MSQALSGLILKTAARSVIWQKTEWLKLQKQAEVNF